MKITYVGPHTDGVVVVHEGTEYECAHGDTIDVPETVARGLLDQESNWQAARTTPRKTVGTQDEE